MWVPICYPRQKYELIDPLDIVCGSSFATQEVPVTVKEISFKSQPHPLGACVCKAYERRQFCESNILWATTNWEEVVPITPVMSECVQVCRRSFATNSNIDASVIHPLSCPWWAKASNTSIFYTAALHTALFHPLQNKLDLLRDSLVSCRLLSQSCWISNYEVVFPREDLFRIDCAVNELEVKGWLRLDDTDSATLRLVSTEEVLSFTHLCRTQICGKDGILSDEGVLVAPETFPDPIKKCDSTVQSPGENKMLAHTEFVSSVIKREVTKLSRDVCTLASNIITVMLKLGVKVQSDLIKLLDEGFTVKDAYVVHSGKILRKPCIRAKLHRYTHLCPGVWEANTTKGKFYAHGILPELRADRPECSDSDNITTLPGGYVIVKRSGELVAVPGSRRHHDVIYDLTHHALALINGELSLNDPHAASVSKDKHARYGYSSLLPDLTTWFKVHPLLAGFLSTILVLALFALALKMILGRCTTCRRQRPSRRRRRQDEPIVLVRERHPGSPQIGPIL